MESHSGLVTQVLVTLEELTTSMVRTAMKKGLLR